jgi:hypothetical protein
MDQAEFSLWSLSVLSDYSEVSSNTRYCNMHATKNLRQTLLEGLH